MATTTIRKVYGGDVCGTCHRWIPGNAPGRVTTPDAFCACPGITDADEDAQERAWQQTKAYFGWDVPETAPSIPERVTAVKARLQALLDDVKVMSIQLGAWERAMTASDVRPKTSAAWRPPADADDAVVALLATIEKLEKGTY